MEWFLRIIPTHTNRRWFWQIIKWNPLQNQIIIWAPQAGLVSWNLVEKWENWKFGRKNFEEKMQKISFSGTFNFHSFTFVAKTLSLSTANPTISERNGSRLSIWPSNEFLGEKFDWKFAFIFSDNVMPQIHRESDHSFQMFSFLAATDCCRCGKLLRGAFFQGYKCQSKSPIFSRVKRIG